MFRSSQFVLDKGLGRVALGAFGLGFAMALHVALLGYYVVSLALADDIAAVSNLWHCTGLWCVYAVALSFFHVSEFMLTASFKPQDVSYESFLLNHSKEYHFAVGVSFAEFWIESLVFPSWKAGHPLVLVAGLVLVVIGQTGRIAAMWTAASNFSHRIEHVKRSEHVLVTHGVYRFVRHPSYMGWFLWTVGSQLLLANPICAVGYTIVSWGFFKDRIPYEEELLLQFFPEEYPIYRSRTFSGVPFVR